MSVEFPLRYLNLENFEKLSGILQLPYIVRRGQGVEGDIAFPKMNRATPNLNAGS